MGEPYGNAPLPGPDAVDLRTLPAPENDDDLHIFNPHPLAAQRPLDRHRNAVDAAEPLTPGSNNFAVAGALTADGRAIVPTDMNLGLRAPTTWFSAHIGYPDQLDPSGQGETTGF